MNFVYYVVCYKLCSLQHKPKIDHLRILGCVCYVHIPVEKRHKWDFKAIKFVLISMEDKELKITSYMIVHFIGHFLEEMSTLTETFDLKF